MTDAGGAPRPLPLTAAGSAAYAIACYETAALHSAFTDVEHLLIGLLKVEVFREKNARQALPPADAEAVREEASAFATSLQRRGVDCVRARRLMRDLWLRSHPVRQTYQSHMTPRCADVLRHAGRAGGDRVGLADLWRATLEEPSALIDDLLEALQLERRALVDVVERSGAAAAAPNAPPGRGTLLQHGRDLTALARDGQLHPVMGRDTEIRQVARALTQSKKRSAVLVGEAGVGKTAVVEGLARRIAEAGAAGPLAGLRIVEISLGSLLAGARYRGDFEERLQDIIAEAERDASLVLFIDEIHTLLGAGDRVGGNDAANLLKPALGRGRIRVIGATTADEYTRFIERDGALERRFHVVTVAEPTAAIATAMLEALAPALEAHHGVVIQPAALEQAVALSMRHLPDRRLPDKAIDVVEQACARARLATLSPQGPGDRAGIQITPDDIAQTVAELRGVSADRVVDDVSGRLATLETELVRRVCGQSHAIREVVGALRAARSGFRIERAPLGVFLFAGPTGTGKTELARALADCLTGDRDALIHLDMSEYAEKHSLARLVGAPPGYVGHDQGGYLTERVRAKPFSVVLFDEIEKAHPDVFDLFLQIFDEGRLTDGRGRTVSFRETVITMTSNAGTTLVRDRPIGFGNLAQPDDEDSIRAALQQLLRPEIRARIHKTIVFRPLGRDALEEITAHMLDALSTRLSARGIRLVLDSGVLPLVLSRGAADAGARGLRRAVAELLEEPIGRTLPPGPLVPRSVRAAAEDDHVRLEWVDGAMNVAT